MARWVIKSVGGKPAFVEQPETDTSRRKAEARRLVKRLADEDAYISDGLRERLEKDLADDEGPRRLTSLADETPDERLQETLARGSSGRSRGALLVEGADGRERRVGGGEIAKSDDGRRPSFVDVMIDQPIRKADGSIHTP